MALLCLSSVNLFGQSITVKGKVFDRETKEPITGARIRILSSNTVEAATNFNGEFLLTDIASNDSLIVSLIGYQPVSVFAREEVLVELTPNPQELQSIVVTASREAGLRTQSPVAISKLSPKLIDETKATQVFELINKTPGVIMPSYNNEQHGMSIRQPMGTSAYYLYMEDGVPLRPLGVFNHNALLEVNQFAISSIEVVKGPVSSIYGPEAVGGAVNFITQRPTAVPTARVGIQFDQWGHRRIQFGTGAEIKKFGFYLGGLSSRQTNSWLENSNYDKTAINARLEYHFTERTRLIGTFIYGDYYSQTTGNIDSVQFYSREYLSNADFSYRKSNAYRSRLTLEQDWNNNAKSFITLFQRNNKLGQNPFYMIRWAPNNNPTTATGEVNSNNFKSYGVIAQHSQSFRFLKARLIAGGVLDFSNNDYWAYQLDLNARLNPTRQFVEEFTIAQERLDLPIANYQGDIVNYAGYLQYDFEPLEKLRISLGGRYDLMSLDYINNINASAGDIAYQRFTPKVGATYDLGNSKGLYANYSQGFSPPGLSAIFRPRPNTDPVEFYTNLEPAYFHSYEIGGWAALLKNKIYVDVALYQMDGRNELLNIRQPDNSTDFQSAGKTLHRGFEFGMSAKPSNEYWFRFGGTIALHRFEDFQISENPNDPLQNLGGFEMPSAPRWSWNTELSYYPKWLPNFRTSLEWQYVSGWYQDQINTVKYEGYNLLNLRVGYRWKVIEVYTNVMNLADELFANAATRGNNPTDRTTFIPGAPRTFVFGIQYNFVGKK
ncbi:TonB-dependent receptor [Sphingobacterium sp. lm-10]|uniref:TonB-dependent receptor n=1 Tax=Sphingobacterium sp. lm-10 TaxID=2944904 RepID=UPI002020BD33|nr:TonB-dependent receptor [Sphingobacterium sp. lm-10]MCL7988467.1 TonB-dependent receptor [Sphingobacterium sp. lm-10]